MRQFVDSRTIKSVHAVFYADCRIITEVSEKLVGSFCSEDGIKTFPETLLVVYNFERRRNPDRNFYMHGKQRMYNITSWSVLVLFVPAQLFQQPSTILLQFILSAKVNS
jgi:hypothetical protein